MLSYIELPHTFTLFFIIVCDKLMLARRGEDARAFPEA